MDTQLRIEDLPQELQNIDTTPSVLGWMHPTNQYNVPYIVNGQQAGYPGKLLFHPGPNLERPIVRWVNTGPAANFSITLTLTPDAQLPANTADLVRNGNVIGTASQSNIFYATLNMQANEHLEIVLSGQVYYGGGDMIDFTATKISTNESFDMANDFIANNGAPTGMWQYFYRLNSGYPNGEINSAGAMIKI